MIIRDLATVASGDARTITATVTWEDRAFPEQELFFEFHYGEEGNLCYSGDAGEPSADAFLAACFPLAAVHGEARVRIEGQPCPMLVEGLRTVHAWWASWGGVSVAAPEIEAPARQSRLKLTGERRGVVFLSGGVDSLHALMRNRHLYRSDDPAYMRDGLFIHGFDIGKRTRDPENGHFQMLLRRLEPVATEAGLRLIRCRTNLRHLPTKPDFWYYRHNGAALAAVGHAATRGPAFLFVGGSYDVANPVTIGSHPAVDGLLSSQRVTVIHDGSRFPRLQKVRELANWPTALAALRVCQANLPGRVNCGRCEKCLRTRLELLAAGIEETEAFGPSLTPIALWKEAAQSPIGDRANFYKDLLVPLRARGLDAICRLLEEQIAAYHKEGQPRTVTGDLRVTGGTLGDDLLADRVNSLQSF
jgi:hypothetical protein